MYESFFGLNRRPFCVAPAVDRYFPVANSDATRQALARCIDRAEGVGLLVSDAGLGKSLICEILADQFRDRFPVVRLGTGHIETRRELLQAIAHDLRVPFRGLDDGELRLAVTSYLTSDDRCPHGILILADEAHTFPFAILDELRMLTNVVKDGETRVRLIFAGNLRLEEQLTDPRLESLSQRIVCRRYLEKFDASEASEYIRFQVAAAGGEVEKVFEPAAREAVYQATDGIPRLINQLCDYALLTAFGDDQQPITAAGISSAWAELQQLPGQWLDPAGTPQLRISNGDDDAVIEFGGLSDEDTTPQPSKQPQLDVTQPSVFTVGDFDDDDIESRDEEGVADHTAEHARSCVDDVEHPDIVAEDSDEYSLKPESIPQATDERAQKEFDKIESQLKDVIDDHVVSPTVETDAEELGITLQQVEVNDAATVGRLRRGPEDLAAEQPQSATEQPADLPEIPIAEHTTAEREFDAQEFDEEEVVVDRFAQLEANAKGQIPPMAVPVQDRDTDARQQETAAQTQQTEDEQAGESLEAETPANDHDDSPIDDPSFQIEEDEDHLQVFVDPYSGLYDDDDADDNADVAELDGPELVTGDTDESNSSTPYVADGESSDLDQTIKLPPFARPVSAPETPTQSSGESEESVGEMIRPFPESTTSESPAESDQPRPVLIIEDEDETEADDVVSYDATPSPHDVRVEDYNTLFARLRGAQETSE